MGRGETAARVLERSRAGAVLARDPDVAGGARPGLPPHRASGRRGARRAALERDGGRLRRAGALPDAPGGDRLRRRVARGARVAAGPPCGADVRRRLPRQLRTGLPGPARPTGCRPCSSWPPASSIARASRGGTRSPGWCGAAAVAVLEPGAWLTAPLACDRPGRDAAIRTLGAIYVRLPAERADAFLDWLASATGSGRADAAAAASTWMTWDMVREMRAAGMAFGAHTVDHPVLARCSVERQRREIAGSVARLRDELGQPPTLFSYPIGAPGTFDARTRACLREAGITHAFSLYGGYQRPGPLDPLDIPREHREPDALPRALPRGRDTAAGLLPAGEAGRRSVTRPPGRPAAGADMRAPRCGLVRGGVRGEQGAQPAVAARARPPAGARRVRRRGRGRGLRRADRTGQRHRHEARRRLRAGGGPQRADPDRVHAEPRDRAGAVRARRRVRARGRRLLRRAPATPGCSASVRSTCS